MKAVISSFRLGRHTQRQNHVVINVKGVDDKEKAAGLVGKAVVWKSPAGKEIKGEIKASHGNKGCVRALMETGMPGQSIGTAIEIK